MDCPTPTKECPVDLVKLEHRLTNIESIAEHNSNTLKDIKETLSNSFAKPNLGFVSGVTAAVSAVTAGIVYGLIAYFSKGDIK